MTFNCVTDEGRVRVQASMCDTCIFRSGNKMHLAPGRVEEMVRDAVANESAVICHKTLDLDENSVCKGFFDRHPTQPLQVAQRLDLVEEVKHGQERIG